MVALKQRDVRSALELVYDASSVDGNDPFPREFLAGLARLIPADVIVGYHECDLGRPYQAIDRVEIPDDPIPAHVQEAAVPLCYQDPLRHWLRRPPRRAMKLSDFPRRRLRKLDFYACVWKPLGIDDSLRLWLPAPPGRARQIYLERGRRDFTERDRSLLELLRPSLIKIQAKATVRRHESRAQNSLTTRENEILGWIAEGKTTREIAAILVVSPHTVRTHIQHILEKLDVHTRSAAVARAFPAISRGM